MVITHVVGENQTVVALLKSRIREAIPTICCDQQQEFMLIAYEPADVMEVQKALKSFGGKIKWRLVEVLTPETAEPLNIW